MVEYPADRLTALAIRVGGPRQLGRIPAEQVVQAVPAGLVLDDQAGLAELGQQGSGPVGGEAGEAGRRRHADVRAWVQAE
jgi:hypothetical protein